MLSSFKKLVISHKTSQKEKVISALVLFGYVAGIGAVSPTQTDTTYYISLIKPNIIPPGWVFGVVWSVLYVLIALAGYYAWNYYENKVARKQFIKLYAVNGLLMYLWNYAFFVTQSPINALFIMIGMLIVIELMIITGFKANSKTGYLLVPYLAWVLFATYLTGEIVALN